MVVQWLRLSLSTAGDTCVIPGQGMTRESEATQSILGMFPALLYLS